MRYCKRDIDMGGKAATKSLFQVRVACVCAYAYVFGHLLAVAVPCESVAVFKFLGAPGRRRGFLYGCCLALGS